MKRYGFGLTVSDQFLRREFENNVLVCIQIGNYISTKYLSKSMENTIAIMTMFSVLHISHISVHNLQKNQRA